ncbi:glycine--tRNA ligase subunit beta [Oceanobacillus polygoni]|uniref:Glycine--tRNA ligase beta subunit n=1 Tax=Oceanobacillus polygoni TaxID=1235259 RepID=A0A9X0YWA5_9BACI|nr:glycine--tRNA ligase subunit beta [Oceanobacillus polygoni]MBP2078166.1 glycyl-tRNA synthetase beta chain [Oceanobacillus polygoni]
MARDVLFEIGLEELPARFIDDAEQQLLIKTEAWLKELRIPFGSITSFATPRRLAVYIQEMEEFQTTIEEEAKGPAAKIAKDENGDWTKAAIGFTRGQGKTPEDIYTKEIKGISYIFVKKHIEGKSVQELLPDFKAIIESIQFGKNMRWATETLRYARPIRWLVALFGSEVIPFEITNVKTSNITYGHRFLGKEIHLAAPSEYESSLLDNYVVVNPKKREEMIIEGIKTLEEANNLLIPVDAALLNEVKNLVEYPTAFMGSFEEDYLKLPSEVLITSMKEHQRYFPVTSKDGQLLARFVGVRNGDIHELATVIRGNEKVLRARLSDAEFFLEEDLKQSIDFYQERLERVVFQKNLGTISDKVKRIIHITEKVTELIGLDDAQKEKTVRAATISKFDLMTNMVNEFTELQGIVGEKYAVHFGEDPIVAGAIREHYLPKQANGALPESLVGSIVSIADKLDTIVGCISVGLVPTGSQDPYGLRRQATGVLRIIAEREWDISLETLLDIVTSLYQTLDIELENQDKVAAELKEFFQLRASYLLKELHVEQDVINAVVHRAVGKFDYTIAKAKLLSEKRSDESFKHIQEALVRVLNLSDKADGVNVRSEQFKTESEAALYSQYNLVRENFDTYNKHKNAVKALACLEELADSIHSFFDNNMVMADDEDIRANRLALINILSSLIKEYADLRLIEWKQHF